MNAIEVAQGAFASATLPDVHNINMAASFSKDRALGEAERGPRKPRVVVTGGR